jgi:hypothetical protein
MEGKEPQPPEDWDDDRPARPDAADSDPKKKDDPSIGGKPAEQH